MGQQLELFLQELPTRPYCSDDLFYGVKISHKQRAIAKRYIQHNPPAQVKWLVFDCDYGDSLGAVEDRNLPPPNIAVINKANGHSHLFYGLGVGVVRTDQGRIKPLQYLAGIEFALCEALKADPGYTGLISKNPLHDHWLVYELRPSLYDLGELADYLTLPPKLPKKAGNRGLGRNVTLFEAGRRWAYKAVIGYRIDGKQSEFTAAVLSALVGLNNFPDPLPVREVEGIAKSIAKWTWKHYTHRWSDEQFSKIQTNRAKQGKGVGRHRSTPEARLEAVRMLQEGMSTREVAEVVGVSHVTVHKWAKMKAN